MKQLSKDPFEVAFEEENYDEEEDEQQQQQQQKQQQHQQQQQQQQQQQHQQQQEDKEEKPSPPPPPHESPIRADDDDYDDEIMVDTQTTPSTTKVVDGDELTANVRSSTLNNNNNTNTNNNNKKKKQNQSSTSIEPQLGNPGTSGKNKDDEEEEEEENMDVELGKFPSSGDPDKMAKMQAILSQFTEEQMSRYESFRRSGFQKANMKKLLASITGSPKISVPMTIVVSGIAKMFVGELVETGRMIMTERGETGPIRPCHIREAYRRLKLEGKVPKKSVPRLFR